MKRTFVALEMVWACAFFKHICVHASLAFVLYAIIVIFIYFFSGLQCLDMFNLTRVLREVVGGDRGQFQEEWVGSNT